MIKVDSRVGSAELASMLPDSELCTLEFADFAFTGRGPGGVPWLVGIERKTVGDLISCMTSGRFAGHQLPGLLNSYNSVFLLVEGLMKCDLKNGLVKQRKGSIWVPVQFGKRKYSVNEVLGYLMTIAMHTNVVILQTGGKAETAQYVKSLHHWWTTKDFDEHKSHLQSVKQMSLVKQSLLRRIAAELPGIGWKKSKLAERKFGSLRGLFTATIDDWMEIDGIGKTIANRIVDEFNGG